MLVRSGKVACLQGGLPPIGGRSLQSTMAMFEFLFKYPRAVFSKGDFVLLGAWPKWVLVMLCSRRRGLAWLIRSKLPQASPQVRNWKAASSGCCNSALAALVLLLLVAAGDPRGRAPAAAKHHRGAGGRFAQHDDRGQRRARGKRRPSRLCKAACWTSLQKKFQVRLYRLDTRITRISKLDDLKTLQPAPATRIGDGLEAIGGGSRRLAHRRGGAAERRRGQFRRDRSRHDFHVSQPEDSGAHGRIRRSSRCRTTWKLTTRSLRRARWRIRASPQKSVFISAAMPDRKQC